VASAGPSAYAPRFLQACMLSLAPNQQCQGTEGIAARCKDESLIRLFFHPFIQNRRII